LGQQLYPNYVNDWENGFLIGLLRKD